MHQSALDDALSAIEPQHARGYLADRRERFDDRSVQPEVLIPGIPAGIEQPDRLAHVIERCDVGPFVPITQDAGVG